MSTFVQLQTEVLNHGFGPEVQSRVKDFLNTAQNRIARSVNIRDLLTKSTVTTANGTQSYALPSDFVRLVALTDDTADRALQLVDPYYIDTLPAVTSTPIMYALDGGALGLTLYPTPSAIRSLTLRYFKQPTTLSADADVSALPVDYHDLMVSFAVSRAYRSEGDAEMAQYFYNEFLRDLEILRNDRPLENLDQRSVLHGSWQNVTPVPGPYQQAGPGPTMPSQTQGENPVVPGQQIRR